MTPAINKISTRTIPATTIKVAGAFLNASFSKEKLNRLNEINLKPYRLRVPGVRLFMWMNCLFSNFFMTFSHGTVCHP